jgi:hypothetical protein
MNEREHASLSSIRARLGVICAVAVCIAGGLLVVSTATGAAPATSKARPNAVKEARQLQARSGKLVYGFNGDDAEGRIVNLTPYTWTFVAKGWYPNPYCKVCDHWASDFPATLKPGQDFVYRLGPWESYGTTRRFNGWFTYRADALHGAEYLSLSLVGSHCTLVCLGGDGPALVTQAFNRAGAPRIVSQTGPTDFGATIPNPEIGWTAGGNANVWPGIDASFDFTFQTHGNYTLDAAKAPPQLTNLLNAMCSGATGTTCSYTPTGDIHWGIGDLDLQTSVKSCGAKPPSAAQRVSATPPADALDWHEVTVQASRTRSVAFGGSLTASTELNVFGVIDSAVSVKIGLEHEWADTRTFKKTTRLYVPQDWIAGVWVAPVVGKVTGTLVVSTAVARYTITNFEETASGVSKDLTTPAFNIITFTRQMTAGEYQLLCPKLGARAPAPPVGLG